MLLAASTADGILMAAAGIAVVIAVSAVFYWVGRSEDRARERDRAAREAPPDDR